MKRKVFKPGQLVLTQYYAKDDIEHMKWKLQIYSHYDEDMKCHLLATDSHGYSDDTAVIPYDGNEDKLGKLVEKRQ